MRPRKPKDKNFVENALGVFWRWSRRRLRYTFGEWRTAKVHPDCHVQVGKNFYSVPYQLRGKDVEVRVSSGLVEAFSKLECVARHLRAHANAQGRYVTSEAHLPEAHLAIREATAYSSRSRGPIPRHGGGPFQRMAGVDSTAWRGLTPA